MDGDRTGILSSHDGDDAVCIATTDNDATRRKGCRSYAHCLSARTDGGDVPGHLAASSAKDEAEYCKGIGDIELASLGHITARLCQRRTLLVSKNSARTSRLLKPNVPTSCINKVVLLVGPNKNLSKC